jgi:hypothetical protein
MTRAIAVATMRVRHKYRRSRLASRPPSRFEGTGSRRHQVDANYSAKDRPTGDLQAALKRIEGSQRLVMLDLSVEVTVTSRRSLSRLLAHGSGSGIRASQTSQAQKGLDVRVDATKLRPFLPFGFRCLFWGRDA